MRTMCTVRRAKLIGTLHTGFSIKFVRTWGMRVFQNDGAWQLIKAGVFMLDRQGKSLTEELADQEEEQESDGNDKGEEKKG